VAAGLVFAAASFFAIGGAGSAMGPVLRWIPLVWGGPWALSHGSSASYLKDWAPYWIAIPGALGVGCLALWMASRALSANWRKTFAPGAPAAQPSWRPLGPLVGKAWPSSGVEAVARLFYARSGAIGWGVSPGVLFVVLLSVGAALSLANYGAKWVFLTGVKVMVLQSLAWRGVQSLWQERREGTLEMLLATPMSPLEILQGFSRGLRQVFVSALVVCGVSDGLAVALCLWTKDMGALAVVGLGAASFWWAIWGLSWGSVWAGVNHERIFAGLLAALFCGVGAPVLIAIWVGAGLFGGRGVGGWVVLFLASAVANRVWVSSVRHQAAKHGMAVMLRPWRQAAPVIESEWSPIDWQADAEPGSHGPSAALPGS